MGSLMAGWDSHIQDPKFAKLMRNKSETKERIEEYWRSKKKTEEEHFKSVSTSPDSSDHVSFTEGSTKEYRRSSSLPLVDTKEGKLNPAGKKEADMNLEDLKRSNCWWTRSNWAFLNERPVIEAEVPTYKYASQHHVTSFAPTKLPDNRIAGI